MDGESRNPQDAFDAILRARSLPENTERVELSWDALGFLEFDRSGNLWWAGHKVEVAQKLKLYFWQGVFGIAATLATIVIAIISLLDYLKG